MMNNQNIYTFTFNAISVNTYVLVDEPTKACAIVDCGCMNEAEQERLLAFINERQLKPELLLFTHLHFDHNWGVDFAMHQWGLKPMAHNLEATLSPERAEQLRMFGIPVDDPSLNTKIDYETLTDGQRLTFGSQTLEVLFVPGHSAGHVAFYNAEKKYVVTGDALFYESIGRTDLQGGDYQTLINSIRTKLLTLPLDTVAYPGHGPSTTVEHEQNNNPFI